MMKAELFKANRQPDSNIQIEGKNIAITSPDTLIKTIHELLSRTFLACLVSMRAVLLQQQAMAAEASFKFYNRASSVTSFPMRDSFSRSLRLQRLTSISYRTRTAEPYRIV